MNGMRTVIVTAICGSLLALTLVHACSSDSSTDDGGATPTDTGFDGGKSDGGGGHDASTPAADAGAAVDASDAGPGKDSGDDAGAGDAGADAGDAAIADGGAEVCDAATCVVDVVATLGWDIIRPNSMVTDADNLYFAHLSKDLYKVPKAGGAPSLVASEPDGEISSIAEDADHLYLVVLGANDYRIDEVAKAGGAFRLMFTQADSDNIDVDNIIVDADALYLGAGKNLGGPVDLVAIDKSTATPTVLYPGATYSIGRTLAESLDHLYWISSDFIRRAPKTGTGAPQDVLMVGTAVVSAIAVDGDTAFYTYKRSVELHAVTGGADATLTTTSVSVDQSLGPMLDAASAYILTWDNSDMGTIYRVPRAGGPAEVFADLQFSARAMTQDDTYVYWAVAADGSQGGVNGYIVRKPK